jgi:enoyl-CoA hydratase
MKPDSSSHAYKYECFDVGISGGVAHVQMKRPQALNSMIPSFWRDLPAIVKDIDEGARARCIVISSTGKHFSAGMDLAAFSGDETPGTTEAEANGAGQAFRRHIQFLQEAFSCLDEARMPVLVAIQGGCIGGAVDMTSACDIRYATKDAFFCIQEINIGMTADVGTFPRLCKLIPEGWVRELAYTGRRLPAETALRIGLVNAVFDTHEEMLAQVLGTAREIASKAPLAIAGSKEMINYARDHTLRDGLDYIATWQLGMFSPALLQEAVKARQESREAIFPNLIGISAHWGG